MDCVCTTNLQPKNKGLFPRWRLVVIDPGCWSSQNNRNTKRIHPYPGSPSCSIMAKHDDKTLRKVARKSKKHKNSIPATTTTPKDSTSSSTKSKTKHHGMTVKSNREHDTSSATADDESMIPMSTTTAATTVSAAGTIQHEFVTNALDHCETPRIAYEHLIESVLLELGSDGVVNDDNHKTKTMATMRIWDPYYCNGATKRHLQALGFNNVIHENQDFYKLIECKATIPDHDVFLTNPPYSEDHIERLLTFLNTNNNNIDDGDGDPNHDNNDSSSSSSSSSRPFCLLLPNWVARKKEYKTLLSHKTVFYVSPVEPYGYQMPSWNTPQRPDHVGEDGRTTPYLSSWYIHAGTQTEALVTKLLHQQQERRKTSGVSHKEQRQRANPTRGWVVARTIKGLKWNIQKQKQIQQQQQQRR
jgi:hypothetical protein